MTVYLLHWQQISSRLVSSWSQRSKCHKPPPPPHREKNPSLSSVITRTWSPCLRSVYASRLRQRWINAYISDNAPNLGCNLKLTWSTSVVAAWPLTFSVTDPSTMTGRPASGLGPFITSTEHDDIVTIVKALWNVVSTSIAIYSDSRLFSGW